MCRIIDNNPRRALVCVALVRIWAEVEDGPSLLAEMLTVAALARSHSQDIAVAIWDTPRLAEAFEKHPHLASSVKEHRPALHILLDAFKNYEAAHPSGQTH